MSRSSFLTADIDLAPERPYAERADREPGLHDKAAEFLLRGVLRPAARCLIDPASSLRQIVRHAAAYEKDMRAASDQALLSLARRMRLRLRRDGFTPQLVGESFALVREAAARTIGQRHFETQLMAGWALLQGKMVEMATGEGKTFAATLPASTVAMAGYPVHVVTVNDYLAARDATEMGPLYSFLGLSVGAIVQGMPRAERKEVYGRSIVYCTNKELAFDYLRDVVAIAGKSSRIHLALDKLKGDTPRDEALVLRGLYCAIVDEADSVFIDEARTPLILSASTGAVEEKRICEQALEFGRLFVAGEHYVVNLAERSVVVTGQGQEVLAALTEGLDGVWSSIRTREELVRQALTAMLLFKRDQHYVVSDGKVQIVDEATGRIMPDRSWERGLHQLIEVNEGCEPTERRETLARITYQRLFRRFVLLSGMSGTAWEVAGEVRKVYGLDTVRIPLHRPSLRRQRPLQIWLTEQQKWQAVVDTVRRVAHDDRRPVLIGTRSVGASEMISALLSEHGIQHALLNAKQDSAEAEVIAAAGQPGQVTVATNMAGRGTDIRLGPGVAQRGGLHVILTEYHDSRRIDRQLFGRSGRQGDPGSCEAIVSPDDEVYVIHAPRFRRVVAALGRCGVKLPSMYWALRGLAQWAAERRNAAVRVQNLRQDRRLDQMLSFSGRRE